MSIFQNLICVLNFFLRIDVISWKSLGYLENHSLSDVKDLK